MKRDNNVDGKYDYREVYTLNANGFVTEKAIDLTNDSKIDLVTKDTLNAKGDIIETRYYNQAADGVQTYTGKDVYKLDSNGNITEKSNYSAANLVKLIETYENDALGRVAKMYVDNLGDNIINSSTNYIRNANGQVIQSQIDIDNNNTIDSTQKYTLDALGRIIKTDFYNGTEETPNSTSRYKLDVYGNRLEESIDNGNNGSIDRRVINTYDELNRVASSLSDINANGIKDRGDIYVEYTYNEYNQVASSVRENVGSTPTRSTNTYNDLGQVVRNTFDYNNDGLFNNNDVYIEYTYGTDGRIASATTVTATGSIRELAYNEWNTDGVRIKTFSDAGGDGTINSLSYGWWAGRSTVNHTDDLTRWTPEQLAKFNKGLTLIYLSDTTAATNITLNADVVKAISNKGFDIRGDATDTVNLGGNFTKVEGLTKNVDTGTLQAYRADIDDSTYTLYIDTDIQLNIVG
ncbi:hypothetical protein [Mannheimia indoligenes]|uniref:hypothetical protein n=1 Tax=Mannheimia indoligenes TaxID=3103145 RepID=UPI002FE64D2C